MHQGHTISNLISNINFVLRRFYAFIVPKWHAKWHILSWRRSKVLRTSAVLASFLLILTAFATLVPIYNNIDITEALGSGVNSSLTVAVTNDTASVDLIVNSSNGTFVSSVDESNIAFKVGTNNYKGYTVSFNSIDGATDLTSTSSSATLTRIQAITSKADFSANTAIAGSIYNGTWGYLPSIYNSTANIKDDYYPAPDGATTTTLNSTGAANGTTAELAMAHADSYTIGVGARASYAQASGTYTGSFRLTATTNPADFIIYYNKGTNSAVNNLPASQQASTSVSQVKLTYQVPTREYYTFAGWCTTVISDDATTCTSDTYASGDTYYLDTTEAIGDINLYAIWTPNKYDVTLIPTEGVNSISLNGSSCTDKSGCVIFDLNYGQSYTLSASLASGYSFSSWNNKYTGTVAANNTSTTFTVGGSSTILIANANASTHSLKVNFENSGVTSVKVCEDVNCSSVKGTVSTSGNSVSSLSANKTYFLQPTLADNYESTSWLNVGSYGKLTFTMGSGNGEVTVVGNASTPAAPGNCTDAGTCMQTFTLASCPTSGTTVTDARDGKTYTVAKLNDNRCWMVSNLNLAGGTEIESTLSDVPANYTLPTANGFQSGNRLPASSTSGFSSDTTANVYNSNSTSCGNNSPCYSYYSWTAATAGSGLSITANDTDASYSICPKGWKLPTSRSTVAGNSDFYKLAVAYGMASGSTSQSTANFYNQAGPGTTPNFLLAGNYSYSSFYYGGSYGSYWSSTSYDSTSACSLYFNSSGISSASNSDRRNGFSVRCVLAE